MLRWRRCSVRSNGGMVGFSPEVGGQGGRVSRSTVLRCVPVELKRPLAVTTRL